MAVAAAAARGVLLLFRRGSLLLLLLGARVGVRRRCCSRRTEVNVLDGVDAEFAFMNSERSRLRLGGNAGRGGGRLEHRQSRREQAEEKVHEDEVGFAATDGVPLHASQGVRGDGVTVRGGSACARARAAVGRKCFHFIISYHVTTSDQSMPF